MAILKLGPLIADVAGPIGATVFKRTRAGHVAQRRTGARAIGSTAQLTIRATVARLASIWRNLETDARLKWIRYAAALRIRTPPPRLPGLVNPYNLFLAYNVPSVALGAAVAEAPPSGVGFNTPMHLTHTFYTTTLIALNYNVDPLLTGDAALVYFSRPFRRSQTNPRTWNYLTFRTIGPRSTPLNYTLTKPVSVGMHFLVTIVRHSGTFLDALPQIIRTAWTYP